MKLKDSLHLTFIQTHIQLFFVQVFTVYQLNFMIRLFCKFNSYSNEKVLNNKSN